MALTAKKVYAILKRQISDMEAKLNSPVRYRGTVATADLLPLNPDIGDMYNIESKSIYGEAGMNVAWNGVVWDTMGAPIDMSLYLTKEEAETVIQRLVTEYFEKNPVKPGATTEQAQQIEQNKTDVALLKKETTSLKEDISTKITKFYASNQGETNLQDSDDGKIIDMMLYGRSEQKQYSGKNLLNATLQTTTQNGVTCTNNGDGTYTVNGTASADTFFVATKGFTFEKDKKYKIVGCPKGGGQDVYRLDGSLNANSDTGDGKEYTGDGNSRSVRIIVFQGQTANNLLFKPMITTDLTATYDDFEPYTGGIPSPNPSYPQEIKSVVNPTVKVCGKNLLKATAQTQTIKGVAFTNNGDGTYTVNGTATGIAVFIVYYNFADVYGSASSLKMVGCPSGGSAQKYFLRSYRKGGNPELLDEYGSGISIGSFKESESNIAIIVKSGATVNNLIFKPMLTTDTTATYDDFEPYHEQTVALPYTLNAIPVSSGGNVTIDGQQYMSDYFDVERGKLVRMCKETDLGSLNYEVGSGGYEGYYRTKSITGLLTPSSNNSSANIIAEEYKIFAWQVITKDDVGIAIDSVNGQIIISNGMTGLPKGKMIYTLAAPEEIDLTTEEVQALKALATYYPTTNISVNSEQLDGYTVFNYPISMENGWNYVKQQIGDTREYIYDMDARAQDTDLQAAEAYVNSEYAVALTELEV